MAENSVTTVKQLKNLSVINKAKFDALHLEQEILNSRMDAQVTASTDPDADYAAELVDGRSDAWGNENPSLGTCIREGQRRQTSLIQETKNSQQAQIDELAEARLENLVTGIESHEALRQKVLTEEGLRVGNDGVLQTQLDSLSDAILNIALQLSEIREILRNQE